jgi:hypothetical protein
VATAIQAFIFPEPGCTRSRHRAKAGWRLLRGKGIGS